LDKNLNKKLNKWIGASFAMFALVVFLSGASYAADTVGIVNSQSILFQHPNFEEITRFLLFLTRPVNANPLLIDQDKELDQTTKDLVKKYRSVALEFFELDHGIAEEKDTEAKQRLEEARQERLSREERERMAPILAECRQALEAVMATKKLTVIVERDFVYHGGTDITEDVIRRVKITAERK
jgi:outer membrane protein